MYVLAVETMDRRGEIMTEEQARYEVATSDIGKLEQMQAVTFRRNALVFNTTLDQTMVDELGGGLTKFSGGYQVYWGDFWDALEVAGYEWTDHIPEGLAFNTANNWRRVVKRFPVDVRLGHHHLQASHYIEANHKKLTDDQAIQLMDHADTYEWSVQMVREAVRVAIGKPVKIEKPKLITCQHCDHWIADADEACPYCVLTAILEDIKYGEQAPPPPAWVIEICDRGLEDMSPPVYL